MIRHMRFTDLPAAQRAKQGESAIQTLHRALFMPMPVEQRQDIEKKIADIQVWMRAPQTTPDPPVPLEPVVVPPSNPDPPPSAPSVAVEPPVHEPVRHSVHHEVVVEESLSVDTLIK